MSTSKKRIVTGSSLGIIPSPRKIILDVGKIDLSDGSWKVVTDSKFKRMGARFVKELGFSSGRKKGLKLRMRNRQKEGYLLKVKKNSIEVTASSERGLFYALKTLIELKKIGFDRNNTLPLCEIEDSPSLEIRGFHVDLLWDPMSFKKIKDLVQTAGKYKLNTFLLEYADRFPYKGRHRRISADDTFSRRQVKELLRIAKENYVEIIPQLQCFSYLGYVLKKENYKYLREENEIREQICPLNPSSLTFFKETASQILELHPECKFLHIGGDETRQLGVCPDCSEKVKKYGIDRLYVDYVNEVCRWVKKQGIRPIIWDDILCRYPETLDILEKDTVIGYWDYWASGGKSLFVVARPIGKGLIHDKRWNKEWNEELSDLEKEILTKSKAIPNMEKTLGKKFLSVFGKYLGREFPKRINSFPYLEYYKDKGYDVIGFPACTFDGHDFPNPFGYLHTTRNIKAFSDACIGKGGKGIITTSWGRIPREVHHYGLVVTSHSTWND